MRRRSRTTTPTTRETLPGMSRFEASLEDLERSARVPREQQVEAQDVDPPRAYLEPEELDRLRLLADPTGAGRLDPRR